MTKRLVSFLVLLIAASVFSADNKIASSSSSEKVVVLLKIQVSQKGEIKLDGKSITLTDLGKKLDMLDKENAVVWYYREAAGKGKEPPPQAMEVMKMVAERRLPISMSSKADFSDYIDEQGASKPRGK